MPVFLDEILLQIFRYFDAFILTKICSVCKQWNSISKTPSLWRRLVLRRWQSQRFLFANVPPSSVNWRKVYQEIFQRGNFSPDDMKYFISSRIGEDELVVAELREAMLQHMSKVLVKWAASHPFDGEDNANYPQFNRNFDFYYDTHNLQWTFIDKRQEYIEDLMGYKLSSKLSRRARYIRPYQVMASCTMLYRWLVLFRSLSHDDHGLTFYRIWRQHLKHRETGLVFEVCDWKAAMSCSFLNGKPPLGSYKDDCLELMDLLSHPNFIMHPHGLPSGVRLLELNPPDFSSSDTSLSRQTSTSSLVSQTINVTDIRLGPKLWGMSGTESDEESDSYDSGYFTNCEYFISVNHWDVEEQHTLQTSVAESWSVMFTKREPHLYLVFDVNDESWYFYPVNQSITDDWKDSYWGVRNIQCDDVIQSYQVLPLHGTRVEPIPSCLALYRLICLFDLNVRHYVSVNEADVWSVKLIHNQTQACVELKDHNGWFEVLVTLTEELLAELNTVKVRPHIEMQSYSKTATSDCIEAMNIGGLNCSHVDDYDGDVDDDNDETDNCSIFSEPERQESLFHYMDGFHPPDIEDDAINLYSDEQFKGGKAEGREGGSIESSNLELFKSDVVTLLTLLMNEKFGHPYGTIAGAVA
ncbi:predicted protein [Nematostella vectensis]|uniref:F-box domain-containing protein n=1 Tax=Nematostella vectensis TaxID=45351 RepID=A7STM1_NEMVE|nr:predicted protein [Nematostella vectensis]|eukprot:XP_001625047.1 predicted protein [Nematostella vectensis]